MPGLFFIPGAHHLGVVRKEYKHLLDQAFDKQKRWYETLVRMTDTLWSRTNGSPLCVSDDARLAARELMLTNKDWMKDFTAIEQIRCAACGSLRNPEYPVCATCKAIDPNHPNAKDIKFAQ